MNKIIVFGILVTLAFTAKSQTLDTAFCKTGLSQRFKAVAKIAPFKVQFSDTVQVTHLAVVDVQDDMVGSCNLQWFLIDDNKIVHSSGQLLVTGSDYTNWNKSPIQALQYVGNKTGLTFQ